MPKDYGDQLILKKVVQTKETSPIFRAEITIGGKKYKASLWVWTNKAGEPVMDKNNNKQLKGKIEVDDYQREQQPTTRGRSEPPAGPAMDGGDIPFSPLPL